MREIKFRAWTTWGKMLYLDKNDCGVWISENYWEFLSHFKGTPEHFGDCKDGTILMQFTGLHDSTGKEIYEGDIIKGKFTYLEGNITGWKGIVEMTMPHGYWGVRHKNMVFQMLSQIDNGCGKKSF